MFWEFGKKKEKTPKKKFYVVLLRKGEDIQMKILEESVAMSFVGTYTEDGWQYLNFVSAIMEEE